MTRSKIHIYNTPGLAYCQSRWPEVFEHSRVCRGVWNSPWGTGTFLGSESKWFLFQTRSLVKQVWALPRGSVEGAGSPPPRSHTDAEKCSFQMIDSPTGENLSSERKFRGRDKELTFSPRLASCLGSRGSGLQSGAGFVDTGRRGWSFWQFTQRRWALEP